MYCTLKVSLCHEVLCYYLSYLFNCVLVGFVNHLNVYFCGWSLVREYNMSVTK